MEQFSRTIALIGQENQSRLQQAKVAVFGLGGVGSYAAEALARAGVGELHLIDHDVYSISNCNRQLYATHETVGQLKVQAAKERILSINPEAKVGCYPIFYRPETEQEVDLTRFDYIVDAIDSVSAKIHLILQAKEKNIPIISAMGAGNKLDPTAFQVADLSKTSVCPLAKVMRQELRKRGVTHLKVVYSKEPPVSLKESLPTEEGRRSTPASISFVPSVMGLILAGEVVKDLISLESPSNFDN